MDLQIEGNWNILKGKLKEKYGQLTDDDISEMEGKENQLIGELQKKTGKAKDEIEKEVKELLEA